MSGNRIVYGVLWKDEQSECTVQCFTREIYTGYSLERLIQDYLIQDSVFFLGIVIMLQ